MFYAVCACLVILFIFQCNTDTVIQSDDFIAGPTHDPVFRERRLGIRNKRFQTEHRVGGDSLTTTDSRFAILPDHPIPVSLVRRLADMELSGFKKQLLSASVYGNFHDFGYYYITLRVGSPPQKQSVILDTGSSLLAFPCRGCVRCGRKHIDELFDVGKSNTAEWLSCRDYRCKSTGCFFGGPCPYRETYSEGSSIRGNYFSDVVALGDAGRKNQFVRYDHIGCHQTETNLFVSQKVNGILGVSYPKYSGAESFMDAMFRAPGVNTKLFALCLSDSGGLLTVGGYNSSYHVQTGTKGSSNLRLLGVSQSIRFDMHSRDRLYNESRIAFRGELLEEPVSRLLFLLDEDYPNSTVEDSPNRTVEDSPNRTVEDSPHRIVENSPNKAVEDYPDRTVEYYPDKVVEDYTHKVVEDYPGRTVEDYPGRTVEDYPGRTVEASPNRTVEDYPDRSVEDSPNRTVEDSPNKAVEDYPDMTVEGRQKEEEEHGQPEVFTGDRDSERLHWKSKENDEIIDSSAVSGRLENVSNSIAWTRVSSSTAYYIQVVSIEARTGETHQAGTQVATQTDLGDCLIDSGTTFTYFPRPAFNAFMSVLKESCVTTTNDLCFWGEVDFGRQLCWFIPSPTVFERLPTFTFTLNGGAVVEWRASSYLTKQVQSKHSWCLTVDKGLYGSCIMGMSFLKYKNVIFDRERDLIGFADADCPVVVDYDRQSVDQSRNLTRPDGLEQPDGSPAFTSWRKPQSQLNAGAIYDLKDSAVHWVSDNKSHPLLWASAVLFVGVGVFAMLAMVVQSCDGDGPETNDSAAEGGREVGLESDTRLSLHPADLEMTRQRGEDQSCSFSSSTGSDDSLGYDRRHEVSI